MYIDLKLVLFYNVVYKTNERKTDIFTCSHHDLLV